MTVTGIISAIVVGLIIGALGRLIVPGRQRIPLWLTLMIGIVAALLGTTIVRLAGVEADGFSVVGLIAQIAQIALAVLGVALAVAATRRNAGVR